MAPRYDLITWRIDDRVTDEQWRRVWELYQSSGSASAEQLRAELDFVDDAQVREAVYAMIHRTTDAESLDRIGQKIGRYVLTANLGKGGMGEVYAGRDADLGRSVAVKLLARPADGEPSPVARFLHEGRIVEDIGARLAIADLHEHHGQDDSDHEPNHDGPNGVVHRQILPGKT